MAKRKKKLHDQFIKSVLGNRNRARDFLYRLLPPALSDQLDLSTLEAQATGFVTHDLQELFSDALFRVRLKNADEEECFVSILLEHKSYPDEYVSVQVLAYLAMGYRAQVYRQVQEGKPAPLHPILPFVFQHGGRKTWAFRPLRQLIGARYKGLLEYVPHFTTIYADLSAIPDSEIAATTEAWLRATLLTQRYGHSPEALQARFGEIFGAALDVPETNFFRELMVYYMVLTDMSPTKFKDMLKEVSTEKAYRRALALYDEIVAEWQEEARQQAIREGREQGFAQGIQTGIQQGIQTGIQQGIQTGIQQGIQTGIQQGIQTGLDQAKHETVKRGHANGVPIATLSLLTGYSEAEVLQIIEADKGGDMVP
jgi:predicted transposase/invertase (TIGR01784 family)